MTENEARFLVFGAPLIEEEDIDEVIACLRSGWIGTGPRVAQFEADFASYKGTTASHAAAVNSCTAALHVSMVAAGLDAGAEVITTPLTFCATVNAIVHAGLTPVLADIDPVSHCVDVARVLETLERQLALASDQPPTDGPVWRLHLLAASYYAQIGDGETALRHAELAWQPTSDVAAGSVLAQLQMQVGEHADARRTIDQIASRIGTRDELGGAEVSRLNKMLSTSQGDAQ